MKYKIKFTSQFKKDFKRAMKRGLDEAKFSSILMILGEGTPIPEQYRDHSLSGRWVNHRELHIEPDWLLIYYREESVLVLTLVRTGSHSDLFK